MDVCVSRGQRRLKVEEAEYPFPCGAQFERPLLVFVRQRAPCDCSQFVFPAERLLRLPKLIVAEKTLHGMQRLVFNVFESHVRQEAHIGPLVIIVDHCDEIVSLTLVLGPDRPIHELQPVTIKNFR